MNTPAACFHDFHFDHPLSRAIKYTQYARGAALKTIGANVEGSNNFQENTMALTSTTNTYSYNGHTYRLSSSAMTWQQAEAEAVSLGGHLVSINDAAESTWIKSTLLPQVSSILYSTQTAWLGYTDSAQEGNWIWLDGSLSNYTDWNSGEPNDGYGEDFASLFATNDDTLGRWNDLSGTEHNLFGIIEIAPTQTTVLNPAIVGRAPLGSPSNPTSVSVSGNYAYVTDNQTSSLVIFDISQPTAPQKIGTYATQSSTMSETTIQGNTLYVANGQAGFLALDISNPTQPIKKDSVNFQELASASKVNGVYVVGNKAYVADFEDGVQAFDVSNPANISAWGPAGKSTLDNTQRFSVGLDVSGSHAYVADSYSGLQIFDISSSTPVSVGSLRAQNLNAYKVDVVGNYAYIADIYGGLKIADVSNPAAPFFVSTQLATGRANDVVIDGQYAFVAASGDGLEIFDISNPLAVKQVGGPILTNATANAAVSATGVAIQGRYAYVTDSNSGLNVIDLGGQGNADTTAPTITTFSPTDEDTGVAVGSNIVATFNEAIQRGTGNIVLKTTAGATIATYDAGTSSNLTISGSTLTLNPTSDLTAGTAYKVEFAAGSVKDLAGNAFAGTTSYNFTTTGNSGAPSVSGTWSHTYNGVNIDGGAQGKFGYTAEGIQVFGGGYRDGGMIVNSQPFSLPSGGDVFFKWKADGAGSYSQIFMTLVPASAAISDQSLVDVAYGSSRLSTNHSYDGSTLVSDNTWYYSRATLDPVVKTVKFVTAENNYDTLGGTVIRSNTLDSIPHFDTEFWSSLANQTMGVGFGIWDNYGSTAASVTLGEIRIGTTGSTDTLAPTITTLSPTDEATNVAVNSNIVLNFSEAIQRGTGNIVLKTTAGVTIATYDAATSSNLTVSGNTLTLNPTSDLTASTAYKVEFAAGSLKDLAGNAFAGTTSYNFTTASSSVTPTPTLTKDAQFVVLQPSSPSIVGAGIGDDTYLLSGSMLSPGKSITISDAIGTNSIQLAPGLSIASSQVTSTALKFNLSNGGAVTVLGANAFTYETGGNTTAGLDDPDTSYQNFVTGTLGSSIPSSGVATAGSLVIDNISPASLLASAATGDDFVVLQYASPNIVGAGTGNDTYLLSSALLPTGTSLTISDATGTNSIQLAPGLSIASSQVTSTALKLTLTSGATVTVLGANNFTYDVGGNTTAGIDPVDVSYASLVQTTLGTMIPTSGVASGGAVVIGGSGSTGTPVQGNATVNATAANDVFYFDAVAALLDAAGTNTQASISGFSTSADRLQINLPTANAAITNLGQLNGQQGVIVQSNSITGELLVNFGNDANGGQPAALTLIGVTDPSLVMIQVV